METQETPHNAKSIPPSIPLSSTVDEQSSLSDDERLRSTKHQEQQQIPIDQQKTQPQLSTSYTHITIEQKENNSAGAQQIEMVHLDIEKGPQETRTEATFVLQEAEHEARHLIVEAESHEPVQLALLEAKTFGNFWLKILNDWLFNFASGLAYHLLTAMFPIVIVLLILLGFISNNPQTQQSLLNHLEAIFPHTLANQNILEPALVLIRKDAGWLSILAVILGIFNGSRLFVTLEDYFDVIYHTPARSFWRQNLMAISLLLLFILLIPIMLLASSTGLQGFLEGLAASWCLFEAIYLFVPNQHISLRNSWLGAMIAALALQIYVVLFPFYVRHFLGSYTGNAGFIIILLLFFYYFAVILLVGAEINAFYAEDIRGTPTNIAGLVHRATLAADKQKISELLTQKDRLRSMKTSKPDAR